VSSPPDRVVPETPESPESTGPLHLLNLAWRYKMLVSLGAVVGLVLGALYFAQKAPVYRASATLTVRKKESPAVSAYDIAAYPYDDYLATELTVIKSTKVVQRAVEDKKLGQLPSFQGYGDPTGAIRGGLAVARDNKDASATSSAVLTLSYSGPTPGDCPIVLNAILDSYQKHLDEMYQRTSRGIIENTLSTTANLQKKYLEKQQELDEFRKKTPLYYVKTKDGSSLEEDWLGKVQAQRLDLMVHEAELQGQVDAIERAIKEGRGRETLLAQLTAAAAQNSKKPGGTATEPKVSEQLLDLMLKEQRLLADYGKDHPEVQAVRKHIAMLRDFFRGTDKDGKPVDFDPVQMHLQALRQDLAKVKVSLATLGGLTDKQKEKIEEVARYRIEEQRLQRSVDKLEQMLAPLQQKIQEMDAARGTGGLYADVIEPPGIGVRSGSGLMQNLMLGGVLGLLLGFGLAYLADMTDRSFRTPEEIQRRLGLPVIGHIPMLAADAPVQGSPIDPRLYAYHRPQSVQAEAFRGVRTALYFSTHGDVHKVIQITSPNASDGKSTLAANLATSIAQSGKRVVLVDADFRKPRQHRIFAVPADVGLAQVIAGEAELKEVIRTTAIAGVFVLPCGPVPSNPAELLTGPRFKELLDVLREQFDFVIVDTPPLLAVSDPSVVAPRVDGVLLALRVSKNGRPSAERAKEALNSLGANILGVVVNGVGSDAGASYGYESGQYGYGYYRHYSEDAGDAAKPESASRRKSKATIIQRVSNLWKKE
jgi:succinoglycan biosynthesis transport protein ExoP